MLKKISLFILLLAVNLFAQVKPRVSLIGGDNVPQLKQKFENTLELVLLEMNRISKGKGDTVFLQNFFNKEAYQVFKKYILQNNSYTARKQYEPQMIERQRGEFYDIRSITVKVDPGGTETTDNQSIIFTFDRNAKIVSVRSVLPNYDYHSVLAGGISAEDSLMRGKILDFIESFRIAYNTKDIEFLNKVYSDDALIITGSVLTEKKSSNDMLRSSLLSPAKIKLIQQTKGEYLSSLKNRAFKNNSFINVRFEDLNIIQHEKFDHIYGVSCIQEWNASNYSDRGYLFLMMDFQNPEEPIIHVRTWQPKAFDDSSYVNLYDFNIASY